MPIASSNGIVAAAARGSGAREKYDHGGIGENLKMKTAK